MQRNVILDTGVLVAVLDKSDRYHTWAVERWSTIVKPVFTCEAVISESCFLLQGVYGSDDAIMGLVRCGYVKVPFHFNDEVSAIAELMQKYKSVPMSFADACLVRMSELIAGSSTLTLDSDFRIYRKNRTEVITVIIPDEL
ncbi:type II toxin-antitoxin system VapC family toxin [Spirulina sp. 06S082]|uniref:type II toxin-antitoxin system VapC family toxin n=1 Tax=Spirulina sp. 06S082 TaxID=3110248 RepID=UPI002B1F3874|nr:PIN domain-containing protein [Spirulina sp. 06S082]MEA5467556.1 PIN domain-containing protein [Spirulina sp. 06S082]